MKTKTKHIFFLAFLTLATLGCGGRVARPASGFDVSVLSPRLLSIQPQTSGDPSALASGRQVAGQTGTKNLNQQPAEANNE